MFYASVSCHQHSSCFLSMYVCALSKTNLCFSGPCTFYKGIKTNRDIAEYCDKLVVTWTFSQHSSSGSCCLHKHCHWAIEATVFNHGSHYMLNSNICTSTMISCYYGAGAFNSVNWPWSFSGFSHLSHYHSGYLFRHRTFKSMFCSPLQSQLQTLGMFSFLVHKIERLVQHSMRHTPVSTVSVLPPPPQH